MGFAGVSKATIYGDSTGENFTGAGGGILDISSVEVTHNATDLIFKINVTGDLNAADWGKYMIGLDTIPGGDTTGNGMGTTHQHVKRHGLLDRFPGRTAATVCRFINTPVHGRKIGASGLFAGGPAVPGLSITRTASFLTITTPQSLIGVGPGSTICFDVYTSGGNGGDSAVDALGNPAQSISDWGIAYNTGTQYVTYTIPSVPEPAMATLLGLGGLIFAQRTFRRR